MGIAELLAWSHLSLCLLQAAHGQEIRSARNQESGIRNQELGISSSHMVHLPTFRVPPLPQSQQDLSCACLEGARK